MDDTFREPPIPSFNRIEEECTYWKEKCMDYKQKLSDAKQEYNDFVENSQELEAELETTLEQREKAIRDLKHSLNQIQNDNESLRKKISNFELDYNTLETNFKKLNDEYDELREHTRKVEQKNDDLERANRVVAATVNDLETMLNQAYEKNEFLELEVEDKESLSVKHQRVLDELRDLKQEMKVKVPSTANASHNPATHSDNILNGNTPPIASQKAFNIIADSLRRIDIMAAKLKACQEIMPPPSRETSTVDTEIFAHQASRRKQSLLSLAAGKSSSTSLRSINGSMNVVSAKMAAKNTELDKTSIADALITKAAI